MHGTLKTRDGYQTDQDIKHPEAEREALPPDSGKSSLTSQPTAMTPFGQPRVTTLCTTCGSTNIMRGRSALQARKGVKEDESR